MNRILLNAQDPEDALVHFFKGLARVGIKRSLAADSTSGREKD